MRKLILTSLACLLSIAVFAGAEFFASTHTKYPRVRERDVLLMTEAPKDAVQVGIVVCNTRNEIKAIVAGKDLASKRGANVLVMATAKDMSDGGKVANLLLGAGVRGKYVLIAYRIEDETTKK